MAENARQAKGRPRADRVTRNTVGMTALLFFLPLLQRRAVGAEAVALLVLPFSVLIVLYLLSEALWERSVFRAVRLLVRAGRYREAGDCRSRVSRFGALAGLAAGAVLLVFEPLLFGAAAARTGSRFTMLAILPAFIFTGACGAQKGYLRACAAKGELALMMALQALLLLLLPCVFGVLSGGYGARVDALLLTDQYTAVYGAVGAMAGVSLALFVIWLIAVLAGLRYRLGSPVSLREEKRGGYVYASPEGLLFLLGLVVVGFDLWRWFHGGASGGEAPSFDGNEAALAVALFGRYSAAVFSVAAMAGCVCSMPFLLSVYQVHARYQREDDAAALDRFAGMVRHVMILTLPVAFLMSALATPLTALLNGKPDEEMAALFRVQILAVPLLCLGILLGFLFVKFGGIRAVLLAEAAGAAVHILLAMLLSAADKGFFSFVLAHLCGTAVSVAILWILLSVSLSYRQEWLHGLLIPLLSAALSSLPAFALAPVLTGLIGETLTVALLAAAGFLIDMALITLLHGVTEYELYRIPAGRLFIGLARLFGRGI